MKGRTKNCKPCCHAGRSDPLSQNKPYVGATKPDVAVPFLVWANEKTQLLQTGKNLYPLAHINGDSVSSMANPEHLAILNQGVDVWKIPQFELWRVRPSTLYKCPR